MGNYLKNLLILFDTKLVSMRSRDKYFFQFICNLNDSGMSYLRRAVGYGTSILLCLPVYDKLH